jgi:hypothetical protein
MIGNEIVFSTTITNDQGKEKHVQLRFRQNHPLFESIEESINLACKSTSSYHPDGLSILVKSVEI